MAISGQRAPKDRVADALNEINGEMERTARMVTDISLASSEQQNAMTQLAQNVEQVAIMTEQNVAVVGQTKGAVERLDAVTDRMRKAVMQYRI